MDKKTKVFVTLVVGVVVIVAVVAIYAATAKEETTTTVGPGSTETGGVGGPILSAACAALGIKC